VNAAAGHACMRPLDHDGHALRRQHAVPVIGDLGRHPLLDLKPLGVALDEPRELRNADDPIVRQIADVHPADDRRHVVLAMGDEVNVSHQHHLVIAGDLLECPLQELVGVVVISGKPFLVGARDPIGRAQEPLAVRVVTRPADQRADRLLHLRPVGTSDRFGRLACRLRRGSLEVSDAVHMVFSVANPTIGCRAIKKVPEMAFFHCPWRRRTWEPMDR